MGDKQSRADRKSEAGPAGESAAADSPDVIDLRPHEGAGGNGATSRGSADTAPRSDGRALSATEGWEWLDLGLRISDAQRDVRRTTSRAMHVDRIDVLPWSADRAAADPASDRTAPVVQPAAEPPVEAADAPAPPASGRLTSHDWSNWVRLGRTISAAEEASPPTGEAGAEPEVAEPEAEPEVAQAEVAAEPIVTGPGPDPVVQLTGRPLVTVVAVVIAIVLLVAAIVAVLALTDDKPTPSASARPGGTGAAPTPAGRSLAVRWLEQNTAAGTRLLVPPELVDDFAAGLPGRQVLPNDQVAARTGDLLVVTPNSGDVLTGTLTQQVLAAAPVVAALPGSDLEVHQVVGPNPSDDAARASAGNELLQNLGLTFVSGSAELRSGRVDERVLVILAGLSSQHSLTVALVPDPADAPDALVRTLQIQGVDGHTMTATNARDIKEFVTAQRGALAGPVVDEVDDGTKRQISVTYLLPAPVELLNSGSFPTVSRESP